MSPSNLHIPSLHLMCMFRFLLAQLHLESLLGTTTVKSVRKALARLPTGSDKMVYDRAYKDAMDRIRGQMPDQKDLALQALSWITCAKRPLTSLELRHALAIEEGETQLDEDNIPEIKIILTACAGLVTTEDESGIIRLVHYTTQEFFERTQNEWFPDAETKITLQCITYLSFKDFESGSCESEDLLQERLVLHPLCDYSARHWGDHARSASSSIDETVLEFLVNGPNLDAALHALFAEHNLHKRGEGDTPIDIDGLHLAAYFGLSGVLAALVRDALVRDEQSLEKHDVLLCTPLIWSAKRGHEDTTRFLLEHGANIEAVDAWNRTPLHWAVEKRHLAVTRLLLEWGADHNARDNIPRLPLELAVRNNDATIYDILFEWGARISGGPRRHNPFPFSYPPDYGKRTARPRSQAG